MRLAVVLSTFAVIVGAAIITLWLMNPDAAAAWLVGLL